MIRRIFLLPFFLIVLISGCSRNDLKERERNSYNEIPQAEAPVDKPRIFYINSYNPQYPWAAGIMKGLLSYYNLPWTETGEITSEASPVLLKIYNMRTLADQSQEHIDYAVQEALNIISTWKPDVVIASDDNASKYVIAPHYKDSSLPVVFCGINWDASVYGFPAENITGMVEVSQSVTVIEELLSYAKGERVAFLRADGTTSRQQKAYLGKALPYPLDVCLVSSYQEWKEEFIRLQTDADILVTTYPSTMTGWDGDEVAFRNFMINNTRIPTGGWDSWIADNVLITIANSPEELGEWAAESALQIAYGKSPSEIPVTENKKGIYYINMRLAKNLKIQFSKELIEKSHMVNTLEEMKKIYYVNSYHPGYKWSDSIEEGFRKSLEKSAENFNLKIYYMDSKMNLSEDFIKEKARIAYEDILSWQPDIILGSDDSYVEYLVVPYLREMNTPVLFCGVNWDASQYDLPSSHITGMIEVDPLDKTVENLALFADGDKLGLLFREEKFNHTIHDALGNTVGIDISRADFVSTFEEWKSSFLSMQNETDMMIFYNPVGLEGWNESEARIFVRDNIKIPVGTSMDHNISLALLGNTKISEEQGWWLGKTALRILSGVSPESIPHEYNRESRLIINTDIAGQLGLKIPLELLERAQLWSEKQGVE